MFNKDIFVANVRNMLHAFLSVTHCEVIDENGNPNNLVERRIVELITIFLSIIDDDKDRRRCRSVGLFEKTYGKILANDITDLTPERYAMEVSWSTDGFSDTEGRPEYPDYDWEAHAEHLKAFFMSDVCSYIVDRFTPCTICEMEYAEFSDPDSFNFECCQTLFPKYVELLNAMPKVQAFYAVIMFPIIASAFQMETKTFAHDVKDFIDMTWRDLYMDISTDILIVRNSMPVLLGSELYRLFVEAIQNYDISIDVPANYAFLYRAEGV